MKNKNLINGLLGFLVLTFIAFGCNKEGEVPEFQELSFDGQEVLENLPDGLKTSTDEYAQQCVDAIESALDMSSFINSMDPPEDAEKTLKKGSGDTWKWTISLGEMSYTYYWSYEEASGKKYWTMDIQFGDGDLYNYISAWETMDGSQGEASYNFNWPAAYDGSYEGDYEDLYWIYSWRLDSSGDYHFGWNYESTENDYEYYLRYDIVVKSDGSGTIDYYSLDALFYHMEWDQVGDGSWNYYSGGESFMSGEWTV